MRRWRPNARAFAWQRAPLPPRGMQLPPLERGVKRSRPAAEGTRNGAWGRRSSALQSQTAGVSSEMTGRAGAQNDIAA